jgi:histidinol-phosphate aminotransferase
MKNLALKRIQKMKPYSPPLAARRDFDGLLLDFNERTSPPAANIKASLEQSEDIQMYPEYSKLENLIAGYASVKPEEVMLANGSDQAIEVLFRTFVDKEGKVIIPAPSFSMFFQNADVIGCTVVSLFYEKKDLSYPLGKVLDSIDNKTRLIVVCNPNNPTGGTVSIRDIEKIAQKAINSIIYVDEAYFEFSGVSAIGLIRKYPNVIVSRTFSKAFGLASLRVGYLIANNMYISEMLKVRSPYPVNMAGYKAASAALADTSYMKNYVSEVMKKSKPLVEKFFSRNGITFYPSQANFILFKPDNPTKVYEKLLRAGILLRPQNKPGIEDTLRLTVGTFKQMEYFCQVYQKDILT